MSDLDKLMGKLKKKPVKEVKEEKVEEKPIVSEIPLEEEKEEVEDIEEKKSDPIPAEKVEEQSVIEQEVGVLQNDGIFRREMIVVFKEMVDVQKVIAQTLLDLKKRLDNNE